MTLRMDTYESLDTNARRLVFEMADAARQALRVAGIQPRNDDEAARFDEACARFLVQSRERDTPG